MAKKYRVAVIGRTGRGDYGHGLDVVWLDLPETELVAVADDNAKGLAEAAKRLKVNATFADYRQMLDKTKPDIVAIATRYVDQHRDMVLAAAQRGIHVYMEKPLCRTLVEADEMVAACERTHTKVALAHPTRYSPKMPAIKKLIADGKLGKVLEYRARGKEDTRGGGEDLWVLGSHMMDLIRALGGQPTWCFGVVRRNNKPITRADVGEGNEGIGPLAGDAANAMYGMPDGSTAYFGTRRGMAGKPGRYGLQVYGSLGILEILEGTFASVKYLGDPSWSPGRSKAVWQDVTTAGIGQGDPEMDDSYAGRHAAAIRDLIGSIENPQRQPLCSVYEARAAIEMIVAVFESERLGGPVSLPLKTRVNPLTLLK